MIAGSAEPSAGNETSSLCTSPPSCRSRTQTIGRAVRGHDAVGVAERVRGRRFRRDRRPVPVQAAVRELGMEDVVAVVPDRAAAVLVDAGAGIGAGRRELLAGGVDDRDASALLGAGLTPADAVATHVHVRELRVPCPRDRMRVERRGPGSVRANSHLGESREPSGLESAPFRGRADTSQAPDPQAPSPGARRRPRTSGRDGVLVRRHLRRRPAAERPRSGPAPARTGGRIRVRGGRPHDPRRPARVAEPRHRRVERHLTVDQAGDRRDRGQALLPAPRHRHPRYGTRAVERRPRPARAGRLDDHAAVREERADRQRALRHPEAEGGRARVAARAEVEEGQDPHGVPQHDLLRERRLRRGARGAHVLRAQRREADAPRVRAPRRHSRGSDACTTPSRTHKRRASGGRPCST